MTSRSRCEPMEPADRTQTQGCKGCKGWTRGLRRDSGQGKGPGRTAEEEVGDRVREEAEVPTGGEVQLQLAAPDEPGRPC